MSASTEPSYVVSVASPMSVVLPMQVDSRLVALPCIYCNRGIPAEAFSYWTTARRMLSANCPSCSRRVTLTATTLRRWCRRGGVTILLSPRAAGAEGVAADLTEAPAERRGFEAAAPSVRPAGAASTGQPPEQPFAISAGRYALAVELERSAQGLEASVTLARASDVIQARVDLYHALTTLGWTAPSTVCAELPADIRLLTESVGAAGG